MAFTAKDVSALRERTGCGMMDCKKALTEADGDMDKAIEVLREKGLAKAAKKAGRIAAEGVAYAVVDPAKKVGVVIEVNAETDFVAKNDQFKELVNTCAQVVLEKNPATVEELMAETVDGKTVEALFQEKIMTIGENMKVRRFERLEGDLVSYVHAGGAIGVIVKFETNVADKEGFQQYGKDVAMQIAAMNPTYVRKDEIPAADVAHEKEIVIAEIKNDPKMANKPAQVIEKMVEGRLNKQFFAVSCLEDQAFVKGDKETVLQYTNSTAKALGGEIKIAKFVRYEKGEGIEKKADDFAAEVASMIQ
jgi:elongation factor Ts